MYADMVFVLKELDPQLFKTAIEIVRSKRFTESELQPVSRLLKLYPEQVPDVFPRLWEKRPNSAEALERLRIQASWRDKLKD
jgi:hypothetical protein